MDDEPDYKAALEAVRVQLRHRMYALVSDIKTGIEEQDFGTVIVKVGVLEHLAKIAEVAHGK